MPHATPLLLASQSPRRRELLALTGREFSAVSVETPERIDTDTSIGENVRRIALEKATAALSQHADAAAGRIVVAADTVVALDGRPLGKPADRDEAIGMLKGLQGRSHTVHTGFALLYGSRRHSEEAVTTVTLHAMKEEEILRYIDTMRPYDKAGSYGIQDPLMACHVDRIEGCWYTVVGLPVSRLCRALDALDR